MLLLFTTLCIFVISYLLEVRPGAATAFLNSGLGGYSSRPFAPG